ncbi:MAG: hypothetical protein JWP74_70 [Marmoricola sp.]|nr:hypothetical protein [Marmoricola sp.]
MRTSRWGAGLLVSGMVLGLPQMAAAAARPDLRISAVSVAPGSVLRGKPVTVRLSVRNTGSVKARASTARVYLSTDAVKSKGDALLGSVAVKAIAKGLTAKVTTTVTVSSKTAPATYHLVVCADALGKVRESHESNNCLGTRTLKVTKPKAVGQSTSADLVDADPSLDADTKVLYKVYADFGDSRLPAKYHGASDGEGTALVVAADQWNSLTQATRDLLDPFFLPPFDKGSWYEAAVYGVHARRSQELRATAGATPLPPGQGACLQTATIDTDHWAYVDNGDVRVWYVKGDAAQEKKAGTVGTQANAILPHVNELFRAPLADGGSTTACRGGSDALDVVLGSGTVLHDGRSYTQRWVANGCQSPSPAYVVLNSSLEEPYLDAILVHELTHAANDAYKWATGCKAGIWLTEATAEWMEDYVYGKNYQPEQYLAPSYLDTTGLALDDPAKERYYGAYLFPFFLSHDLAPAVMTDVWNDMESYAPTASLQVALQGRGTDLEQEWPRFVLDNWNQEPRTDYQTWDDLTAHVKPATGFDGSVPVKAATTIPLPVNLPHLSSQTYVFDIDDSVPYLEFDNTLVGTPGADVQALEKLKDGTWREFPAGADIWTKRSTVPFCRAEANQDVSELVVMVSNTSYDPATVVTGSPKLVAKSGCPYIGTISGTEHTTTPDGTANVTFSGTVELERDQGDPLGYPSYSLVSGSITTSGDADDNGCTATFPDQTDPLGYFELRFVTPTSYFLGNTATPTMNALATCTNGVTGESENSAQAQIQVATAQPGKNSDDTLSGSTQYVENGAGGYQQETDWSWKLTRGSG